VLRNWSILLPSLTALRSQLVATTSAVLGVPDIVLETGVLCVRSGYHSLLASIFSMVPASLGGNAFRSERKPCAWSF